MNRTLLTALLATLLATGCCTSKNEAPESNAHEAVPADSQTQEALAARAFVMPYTLELSATTDDTDTLLTATVSYNDALSGQPVMHLDLLDDTELVEGIPDIRLATPIKGQRIAKTFRLRGTAPAAKVTVSLQDGGFGIEVHETYPPHIEKNAQPPVLHRPLPAPIDVDGVTINQGVEVTP
ncbi:MAG: hypothetical protein IKY83_07905 [Proteobacteria bacterium]|nr:hypothetical protein [Pseudomonadota bacterium]